MNGDNKEMDGAARVAEILSEAVHDFHVVSFFGDSIERIISHHSSGDDEAMLVAHLVVLEAYHVWMAQFEAFLDAQHMDREAAEGVRKSLVDRLN